MNHPLPPTWHKALGGILPPHFIRARAHEIQARAAGKIVYPPASEVFKALELTPLERVRIVILGQDPYHGPGQAHGLSFSVPTGVKFPPSLRNILKERQTDIDMGMPQSGDLTPWASRGLLLLNAVLTVEDGKAGSHSGIGWEDFTDDLIRCVSQLDRKIAFVLWGAYAHKKRALINQKKHFIVESPHPSPLSAHRGFFGSRPFSRINDFFKAHGQEPFDWHLPE